ncbi:endoglucanase [Lachnospiraceae bacterium XBB1006]|nr:endoglucanase [Lachnospiraceae bacterium XBB1006]
MRKITIVSILLIVCLIFGSAPVIARSSFSDAKKGALHVEGNGLVDANGKKVQLRGVSTHGLSWFPDYVNKKGFKDLHDKWGANVIRLAMYTEEWGGYCSGDANNRKALKKLVKKGVEYATAAHMYAVIDWHILSDGNPKKHRKAAKAFFKMMSKEFKDYTNVIYELCNEPNGGTSWSTIKSYAEDIIPVIRKNDKDAIIVVGTPTWSQEIDKALADPIKEDNILYTLHFYAATHKTDMRKNVKKVLAAGLPVFVTEFGISEANGNGKTNKKSAKKWIDLLDKYGVSYIAFSLANKAESTSLIKSSCQKHSGLTRSNLTSYGKWYYDLLRSKAGKKK